MSCIAGVVALNPDDRVSNHMLLSMLKAMTPSIPHQIETYALPGHSAVVGGVIYNPESGSYLLSMMADQGPVSVFFVGELFNDEVKDFDSPVDYLAKRYRHLGVDAFTDRLNGSFVAIIVDDNTHNIILVTDHTSSYPLFVTMHRGYFYFASEVKGLLAVDTILCEPDESSVISFLTSGYFMAHRTLVKDIHRLNYATVCQIGNGHVTYRRYWQFSIEPEAVDRGFEYYRRELEPLLVKAVERCIRTGKCGVMLSGGIDSRGIVACLSDPLSIHAITYSGRTKENRHKRGDWEVAEMISKNIGLPFSAIQYEPSLLRAMGKSVFASDGAAGFIFEDVWDKIKSVTGVDYLLVGDESMGWMISPLSMSRVLGQLGIYTLKKIPKLQRCLLKERLNDFMRQSELEIHDLFRMMRQKMPYNLIDELYFEQRLMNQVNPRRHTIRRHGLGVRRPWLDLDVLDFIRKVPERYRIKKLLFRQTVSQINPTIFRFPLSQEDETVDYLKYLAKAAQYHREGSNSLFLDDSLLGQFLDMAETRRFFTEVLAAEPNSRLNSFFRPVAAFKHLRLWKHLPVKLQMLIKAYLSSPFFRLSDTELLLRIVTLAMSIRYLNSRFRQGLSDYGAELQS